MRFRGECGHCGFVAKSVAAMQKHMASHEEGNHSDEEDNPVDEDVNVPESLDIKSEAPLDGEDVAIENILLNTGEDDAGKPKLESPLLEDVSPEEKIDQLKVEDFFTTSPRQETYPNLGFSDYLKSGESGDSLHQEEKYKPAKCSGKIQSFTDTPAGQKQGTLLEKMPTLHSLLRSQITPSPDREGTQQLNSDDFITFLEKDAGYSMDCVDDINKTTASVTKDDPDEIGSRYTSWVVEESSVKKKPSLSFYCKVAGCKETFSSLDILEGHLRFEHPRIPDTPHGYQCKVNVCGKQYKSFSGLLNHLSVDHCKVKVEEDDNEILCILSHCKKKFSSMEEAAKHVRQEHNNENLSLIGLKKIKTEYIENVTMDDHINTSDFTPNFSADISKFDPDHVESKPQGFVDNPHNVTKDIRKLMTGNGYRCELEKCRTHFKTKWEFSNHVRTLHSAIGACVYYCAFCSYAATSMERVKEHTRTACMQRVFCEHKPSKSPPKKKKVPTATLR